jgi:serine/threonine-protein kinase
MDLIVGADLGRIVASRGALPPEVAIEWVAQIADALTAVHDARRADGGPLGLIHRDVSPGNVLIGTDGSARLTDFGIALHDERVQPSTRSGAIKGKLSYMSPEQLQGRPLTPASDVFSLGVTAWEALMGHPLFEGKTATETIQLVQALDIRSPHMLRSEIPIEASLAIEDALARDPAKRPRPEELARRLRAAFPAPPTRERLVSIVAPVALANIETMQGVLSQTWPASSPA